VIHHDPLIARLRAHPKLTSTVFEVGEVPTVNPPDRYVVVQSGEDQAPSRFTGPSSTVRSFHNVYCVGQTAKQARQVDDWVKEQLVDYRLVISGRDVHRPSDWVSRPVILDRDGPFPLPYGQNVFEITSDPT
jgi:hypothetical protein